MDVDNVEVGETYLKTGRINIGGDTTILIHGRHKGTKNSYIPLDGLGGTY